MLRTVLLHWHGILSIGRLCGPTRAGGKQRDLYEQHAGCGFFYEYQTGAAACPVGFFLDPRTLGTCTKPTSTKAG